MATFIAVYGLDPINKNYIAVRASHSFDALREVDDFDSNYQQEFPYSDTDKHLNDENKLNNDDGVNSTLKIFQLANDFIIKPHVGC